MSEKIKLSNGTEFDLAVMGIAASEKKLSFIFASELTYAEIEAIFLDPENYSTIQYLSESGDVLVTYADCVSLKGMAKDIENGTYTVTLSTDAVEKLLNQISNQLANNINRTEVTFSAVEWLMTEGI